MPIFDAVTVTVTVSPASYAGLSVVIEETIRSGREPITTMLVLRVLLLSFSSRIRLFGSAVAVRLTVVSLVRVGAVNVKVTVAVPPAEIYPVVFVMDVI